MMYMADGHKGAREREEEILAYREPTKFLSDRWLSVESDPYVFTMARRLPRGCRTMGMLWRGPWKDVVPRYWTMRGKRVERVCVGMGLSWAAD